MFLERSLLVDTLDTLAALVALDTLVALAALVALDTLAALAALVALDPSWWGQKCNILREYPTKQL